jgi:hypothetical protein
MKRKTRALCLEQLEDRCVPSLSVSFNGSSLSITGTPTSGIVNLTQPGAGSSITVADGTTTLGTFAVTGNLSVTTGNAADTINLTLNTAGFLPGNVTINSGLGNDVISINGGGGGAIRGFLNIPGGFGNKTFNIGNNSGVVLAGFAFITGGQGHDTANIGTGSTVTSASDLFISRVSTVTMGATATPAVIGTNLTILNSQNGALTNTVNVDATVNGTFQYVGGSGIDNVTLAGTYNTAAGSTTNVFNGEGTNSLTTATGATFGGTFSYFGGSGGDSITLNTATFNGDLNLNLGNGNNTWSVGSAFTVLGNMTITAGNGNNNIGSFGGSVNGNLSIFLGNGNETFTFNGNVFGSTFRYTAGTGTTNLTINGNGSFNLCVLLGGGTGGSTVAFGATASVGAATIDFGAHTGTDTFTPPTTITFPLVLRNFP